MLLPAPALFLLSLGNEEVEERSSSSLPPERLQEGARGGGELVPSAKGSGPCFSGLVALLTPDLEAVFKSCCSLAPYSGCHMCMVELS